MTLVKIFLKRKEKRKKKSSNLTSIILWLVVQKSFGRMKRRLSGWLWKCPQALKCQVCEGLCLNQTGDGEGQWGSSWHILWLCLQSSRCLFPSYWMELLGLTFKSLPISPDLRKPTRGQSGKSHWMFHTLCIFSYSSAGAAGPNALHSSLLCPRPLISQNSALAAFSTKPSTFFSTISTLGP